MSWTSDGGRCDGRLFRTQNVEGFFSFGSALYLRETVVTLECAINQQSHDGPEELVQTLFSGFSVGMRWASSWLRLLSLRRTFGQKVQRDFLV